jgi:prophage antirepressor-like protein
MQEESKVFQTFFYQGHQIRTVEHKGETWWVAIDVCKVLEIVNVSHAINGNEKTRDLGLDDDEKDDIGIPDIMGRTQATLCVTEPGLYHLISKSRTPGAKAFGRWIRREVLPAIRKTGSYSLKLEEPQKPHDQLSQWLNWDPTLLRTLSREEYMCLIQYERTRLNFLVTFYNLKYPHVPDNKYPREEHRPRQTETLAPYPVEAGPDLKTILLDYLHKTESVSVRHLQQSGPRLLRNLPADHLRTMLQALVENGTIEIVQVGKAEGYRLVDPL